MSSYCWSLCQLRWIIVYGCSWCYISSWFVCHDWEADKSTTPDIFQEPLAALSNQGLSNICVPIVVFVFESLQGDTVSIVPYSKHCDAAFGRYFRCPIRRHLSKSVTLNVRLRNLLQKSWTHANLTPEGVVLELGLELLLETHACPILASVTNPSSLFFTTQWMSYICIRYCAKCERALGWNLRVRFTPALHLIVAMADVFVVNAIVLSLRGHECLPRNPKETIGTSV